MRYYVCLLLMAAIHTAATAQFGITTTYNFHSINAGEVVVDGVPVELDFDINNTYELQLHYWFRLPNNRIEFQPTLYYGFGESDVYDADSYREYGMQLEVNVYPFDFFGDCGCPTFGKQGPQFQKGIFLQFAPGFARRQFVNAPFEILEEPTNTFIYGGGLGLDIGVSNLLTLTPLATVRRGRSPLGQINFSDINGTMDEQSYVPQTTYQLGLQATFRLDSRNY